MNTDLEYPSREMRELIKAILSLQNEEEAVKFFRDLFSISEFEDFANRWQIVKLLNEGLPYAEIAKKLKTSTTTVTRSAQWLKHGTGGFKTVARRQFK